MLENRVKMGIPIPEDIKQIKDVFVKNRFKLYVVGGAVRDALLGKTPKDWDLATDATPDKVEEIMASGGFKTLPTGKAFGVINVFTDNDEYEIATFRKDVGSGRRPDAVEFTSIDKDVLRRDLTINALFYDIDAGEVVDLVGGIDDLKNGIVRTVGKPEDRFGEDRLRILRAIRFAGRFGSDLDPATDKALKIDSSLEGISGERIRDEFLKGIRTAKSVKHFLSLIDKYDLFGEIFKGLNVSKFFVEERDPIILLTLLLSGNKPSVLSKELNKLKYSSEEIKGITFLLVFTEFVKSKEVILIQSMKKNQKRSGLSSEQIKRFGDIIKLDSKFVSAFLDFELSVSGPEVQQKYDIKPGPELGNVIKTLEKDKFLEKLG